MTKKVSKAAAMAAALAKVTAAKPAPRPVVKRPAKPAAATTVSTLAQQVKELRDGGMAWWQIGHALELPGHATTLKESKGAGRRARSIYLKAYGSVPETARSFNSKTGGTFGHGPRPAGKANHERIVKSPEMETMFSDDLDEYDLHLMLRGRKITWTSSLTDGQEEAYVHPTIGFSLVECPSGKAITFREDTREAGPYNGTPGATRTVRLANIVRVGR